MLFRCAPEALTLGLSERAREKRKKSLQFRDALRRRDGDCMLHSVLALTAAPRPFSLSTFKLGSLERARSLALEANWNEIEAGGRKSARAHGGGRRFALSLFFLSG